MATRVGMADSSCQSRAGLARYSGTVPSGTNAERPGTVPERDCTLAHESRDSGEITPEGGLSPQGTVPGEASGTATDVTVPRTGKAKKKAK